MRDREDPFDALLPVPGTRPVAPRSQRDNRARSSSLGELQRQQTTQGVACDMRRVPARRVEFALCVRSASARRLRRAHRARGVVGGGAAARHARARVRRTGAARDPRPGDRHLDPATEARVERAFAARHGTLSSSPIASAPPGVPTASSSSTGVEPWSARSPGCCASRHVIATSSGPGRRWPHPRRRHTPRRSPAGREVGLAARRGHEPAVRLRKLLGGARRWAPARFGPRAPGTRDGCLVLEFPRGTA